MGRKVGKKRSKHLTHLLNSVHTNWDTPYAFLGLTKHQWKNFNNYAEQKLWRMAVEKFRAESVTAQDEGG